MRGIDREDAFWLGNCIGVVALLVTVFVFAPQKQRERQEHEAQQQAIEAQKNSVAVIFSKKALPEDTPIKKTDIELRRIPRAKVTAHMLLKMEDAVGKTTGKEIAAGQPLLDSDVARSDEAEPEEKSRTEPDAKREKENSP